MNLFDLTNERIALLQKLEAANFDQQTIDDTLDAASETLAEKVEDYGYVIRNRESLEDAMAEEIDRMKARLESSLKHTSTIKESLKMCMEKALFKKVECAAFTIAVQDNPPKVLVFDEEIIPQSFMRQPPPPVTPPPAPDKKAILDAMKAGEVVAGCSMMRTSKLVIK